MFDQPLSGTAQVAIRDNKVGAAQATPSTTPRTYGPDSYITDRLVSIDTTRFMKIQLLYPEFVYTFFFFFLLVRYDAKSDDCPGLRLNRHLASDVWANQSPENVFTRKGKSSMYCGGGIWGRQASEEEN